MVAAACEDPFSRSHAAILRIDAEFTTCSSQTAAEAAMTVHLSLSTLPLPEAAWVNSSALVVPIKLPAEAPPLLEWLSDRWGLDVANIASDILVAATSGRYVLAQLTCYGLQPDQAPGAPGADVLNLSLLSESARQLKLAASRLRTNIAEAAGLLILEHLQGKRLQASAEPATPKLDSELLKRDDASLTIWLPEGLDARIGSLAEHHAMTKSDIIRNGLLLYAAGRIRFEEWTAEGSWRPKRKASRDVLQAYAEGDIRFSRERPRASVDGDGTPPPMPGRRTEFIRQHGKSEVATRVFLPAWLKGKLEALASEAGVPASEHGRRALSTLI